MELCHFITNAKKLKKIKFKNKLNFRVNDSLRWIFWQCVSFHDVAVKWKGHFKLVGSAVRMGSIAVEGWNDWLGCCGPSRSLNVQWVPRQRTATVSVMEVSVRVGLINAESSTNIELPLLEEFNVSIYFLPQITVQPSGGCSKPNLIKHLWQEVPT